MDFSDTPSEAAYRARVRDWLEANAPKRGTGRTFKDDAALLNAARGWQAQKAAAGFAAITLPQSYGGGGGTAIEQVIYRQEEARFDAPFGVYEIGLGMCIPTLIELGSDAIKDRYAGPAICGEEIWCQLFSEPSAGSDLAALRTRADPVVGGWRVNGQKLWSTGAQFSDFGLLLARTDPDAPKHGGLTMFIINMKAPGVEVRPIKQMTGESEFNEVFFTDVFIPDDHRLTAPGGGWKGAMTTLMFERLNVGADIGLIDTLGLLDVLGADSFSDGLARDRLAHWYLVDRGLKLLGYQAITALAKGQMPGPEQSITKLYLGRQAQEMADFALDHYAESGALTGKDLGDWSAIERAWSFGAAMRIAGGTDEILRNIIAERVLGLPPEPRFDKGAR
ncbi:acyl-CoA dehydrogenase family protein [Sphingorhabdus contaminans]|uniref:acyl-CoA dehydrogenase family protein n=1 Tax=Sphingorhabdus contaminans TaxID=1343899 RepID=UPI003D28B525